MPAPHRKTNFLLLLIALTLCVIWGNSLLPASVSAAMSGGIKDFLNSLIGITGGEGLSGDGWLRKAAHVTEFAVLGIELTVLFATYQKNREDQDAEGLPVVRMNPGTRGIVLRAALLLSCGFSVAVVDETIQLFSAGRAGMVQDVWIDFGGFLIGSLVTRIISGIASRSRGRNPRSL